MPQSHHETRCADRAPATEAVVAVAAWWWRGGGRGGHGDRGVAERDSRDGRLDTAVKRMLSLLLTAATPSSGEVGWIGLW